MTHLLQIQLGPVQEFIAAAFFQTFNVEALS